MKSKSALFLFIALSLLLHIAGALFYYWKYHKPGPPEAFERLDPEDDLFNESPASDFSARKGDPGLKSLWKQEEKKALAPQPENRLKKAPPLRPPPLRPAPPSPRLHSKKITRQKTRQSVLKPSEKKALLKRSSPLQESAYDRRGAPSAAADSAPADPSASSVPFHLKSNSRLKTSSKKALDKTSQFSTKGQKSDAAQKGEAGKAPAFSSVEKKKANGKTVSAAPLSKISDPPASMTKVSAASPGAAGDLKKPLPPPPTAQDKKQDQKPDEFVKSSSAAKTAAQKLQNRMGPAKGASLRSSALNPALKGKPPVSSAPVKADKPVSAASAPPRSAPLRPAPPPAAAAPASDKRSFRNFWDLRQRPGNPPLVYPKNARRVKSQGSLTLIFYVTSHGLVEKQQIESSSGERLLDNAALRTLSRYKFFPGAEGWVRYTVHFVLKGEEVEFLRLRSK